MEPNTQLCGIPDKSIRKTLSVPFVCTACFLRFEYESTKVTVSSDKKICMKFCSK